MSITKKISWFARGIAMASCLVISSFFGFASTVSAATITINPPLGVLFPGTVGTPYSQSFTATEDDGSNTSFDWSVAAGTLPGGISLNSFTGLLSGIPSGVVTSIFSITAASSTDPTIFRTLPYLVTISPVSIGSVATSTSVVTTITGNTLTVTATFTQAISTSSMVAIGFTPNLAGVISTSTAGWTDLTHHVAIYTVVATTTSGITATTSNTLAIDTVLIVITIPTHIITHGGCGTVPESLSVEYQNISGGGHLATTSAQAISSTTPTSSQVVEKPTGTIGNTTTKPLELLKINKTGDTVFTSVPTTTPTSIEKIAPATNSMMNRLLSIFSSVRVTSPTDAVTPKDTQESINSIFWSWLKKLFGR